MQPAALPASVVHIIQPNRGEVQQAQITQTTYGGFAPQLPTSNQTGLELFASTEAVRIRQEITGYFESNRYSVETMEGQRIFAIAEENSCWFGRGRLFNMKVFDVSNGTEVAHLSHQQNCRSDCLPCCLDVLEVSRGTTGEPIGFVNVEASWFRRKMSVANNFHEKIFSIVGPPACSLALCCCADADYMFTSAIGQIGYIRKEWNGAAREYFTNADKYAIQFPKDVRDVNVKFLSLAACILIDVLYYEVDDRNRQTHVPIVISS